MSDKRKNSFKSKQNFKRSKYNNAGGGGSKVEIGMRGVLISHDRNREKFCRIDSYRLLNYFADKLYGPEKMEESKKSDSDEDDIESALKSEVTTMKEISGGDSSRKRRFSVVKSGCNNLIFVRCQGIVPSSLVQHLIESMISCENLKTTDIPHTRNILRMHPVDFTCPAYIPDMCKNIPPFLEIEFEKLNKNSSIETKEYSIEYKCRNNSHLCRETVLAKLYEEMKESPSNWKYNCRSNDFSVLIDVLKTICMVSVVKGYRTKKKFNAREILTEKLKNETTEHEENLPANTKEITEQEEENHDADRITQNDPTIHTNDFEKPKIDINNDESEEKQ